MPEDGTWPDFDFRPISMIFGSLVQRVKFSTVSADIAEKSKNLWFFDQKSTLTKIVCSFGKSNPNPFQRRSNNQKIFVNGRGITIFVHFLEGGQGDGRILLGTFEKLYFWRIFKSLSRAVTFLFVEMWGCRSHQTKAEIKPVRLTAISLKNISNYRSYECLNIAQNHSKPRKSSKRV